MARAAGSQRLKCGAHQWGWHVALDHAVEDFALEMKARLHELVMKGYRGWDDPANYQRIVEMMVEHAALSEGEVDGANLAMILWSLRRREGS